MVHLSPVPVSEQYYPGWMFHAINPWKEKISEVVGRMVEAGLTAHWKRTTWARMKVELFDRDTEVISEQQASVSPLSLDDLQGPFYVAIMLTAIAIAMAMVELGIEKVMLVSTTREESTEMYFLKTMRTQKSPPTLLRVDDC